jgi:hypothetical protein
MRHWMKRGKLLSMPIAHPTRQRKFTACGRRELVPGEIWFLNDQELLALERTGPDAAAVVVEIRHLRTEIASLKTEAERDKGAARLAFDTLAEERDHLKAERERHIEAAAHKELDWFAEKRRADLLEAKCAELWQLLETVKYRIDLPAPNISGSNGLRKLLETLPNNPGQLLLDRLRRAEETCAAVYQWAGANEFPVELLDNLSIVAEGSEAEESPDCPYHKELPVAVDLKADLLDHVKALERVRERWELEVQLRERKAARGDAFCVSVPWAMKRNDDRIADLERQLVALPKEVK